MAVVVAENTKGMATLSATLLFDAFSFPERDITKAEKEGRHEKGRQTETKKGVEEEESSLGQDIREMVST